jgi:hypothetical protein
MCVLWGRELRWFAEKRKGEGRRGWRREDGRRSRVWRGRRVIKKGRGAGGRGPWWWRTATGGLQAPPVLFWRMTTTKDEKGEGVPFRCGLGQEEKVGHAGGGEGREREVWAGEGGGWAREEGEAQGKGFSFYFTKSFFSFVYFRKPVLTNCFEPAPTKVKF